MATLVRRSEQRPELIDKIRQFEEDSHFLALHHDALLDQFAEEWVAVFHGNLVAHTSNINELLRELRRKDVPLNRVAMTFLSRRPRTFIL